MRKRNKAKHITKKIIPKGNNNHIHRAETQTHTFVLKSSILDDKGSQICL